MEQTSRDRLIEAWRDYIKENDILVLQDSGKVSETEMSEYFTRANIPVKQISFAFEVYGEKHTTEVANLFKDMYRALCK